MKPIRKAILASIAIHLLLFFIIGLLLDWNWFAWSSYSKDLEEPPIVFEIERNNHEIVESPEEARIKKPPKDARLASDKNAQAQDLSTEKDLPLGDPFSKGDFQFKELPTPQGPVGEQGMKAAVNDQKTNKSDEVLEENKAKYFVTNTFVPEFRREYLTTPQPVEHPGNTSSPPKVIYDNTKTKAPNTGGLSFNTYEWDFAPYMLYLKNKVEGNIYPPPAFTYMGMISGETVVRFKIMPNGELRDLKVLDYKGHETLMETSVRAIEISAPFKPLPKNFPEDYLEVTATFQYLVRKYRN